MRPLPMVATDSDADSGRELDPIALSSMFKALGDPTRLKIFLCLRDCGGSVAALDTLPGEGRDLSAQTPLGGGFPDSLSVGEICCRITGDEKITSSLSAHLKELRLAGLIETQRRGRHILCRVHPDASRTLAGFFPRQTRE